jgi:drug/metabolite transporter (DMT)-like permease
VLLAGIVAVSFASILVRLCPEVPPTVIAAWRLTVAAAVMLPIATARGHLKEAFSPRHLPLGALGGLFLAAHFVLWISSLSLTSVSSSVVLVTTNPLFVGLFSFLFLKERQGGWLVAGILLSVAGGGIIGLADGSGGGGPSPLLGDLLALSGAVMASGYLLVGGRLRRHLATDGYAALVYSFAALFLVVAVLVSGQPLGGYRPASYVFMTLLGLVSQVVGHTAFNWALHRLKTGMVAVTILGEAVGATLLAWLLLSERPGGWQAAGMVLLLAGIAVASRGGKRETEAV